MNAAINGQVGNEFTPSPQYVAIASHFASLGLTELGALFFKQASEEREHAMRFVKHLVDAGAHVEIPAIPPPKAGFASVEESVILSVAWEKAVNGQINALVEQAIKESDHLTQNILSWFVHAQLEEMSMTENLLKITQLAGANRLYIEEYVIRHRDRAASACRPLPKMAAA